MDDTTAIEILDLEYVTIEGVPTLSTLTTSLPAVEPFTPIVTPISLAVLKASPSATPLHVYTRHLRPKSDPDVAPDLSFPTHATDSDDNLDLC